MQLGLHPLVLHHSYATASLSSTHTVRSGYERVTSLNVSVPIGTLQTIGAIVW